jgi:hypothetical protein
LLFIEPKTINHHITMSQVIYLKEQIGSALFYKVGEEPKVIPFHEVGSDIGGIKLDTEVETDKPIIDALNQCIKDRVGGVWLSSDAEYEAKKKLAPWRPSNPVSEPLKVFRPQHPKPVTDRPEDVAAANGEAFVQSRPGPTVNPALAQSLTAPGAPAGPSPAESGAEPPSAPPKIAKPRVGKASQVRKAAPTPPETAPAAA